MHYITAGLGKLHNFEGVCYRGFDYGTKAQIIHEYRVGRPIQWGAFTSVTTDLATAKGFAPKTHIVFKIEVTSGRDINPYSLYPQEAEILLLPSHEFTVSSKPRVEHGYTIIDLVQKSDQEALVS
jgi:hypothetical protein